MMRLITIIALILIFPILASAAVPNTISWQGIVEDGSGFPLQGNHTLVFRLYIAGSGGTHIWEETHAFDLVDGLAEATLGSIQSLAGTNFDQPLWLGLSVDASAELTPRVELTAVPYALAVDDGAAVTRLNGLSGAVNLVAGNNVSLALNGNDITIHATVSGGADGDWNIVGNNLTLGVSGNVGIGNSNPVHKLDIRTPTNVPVSMRLLSGGSWSAVLEQSPESILTIMNGGSKRFAIDPGGRVGIGTTAPAVLFHIDSPSRTNEMLIGTSTGPGTGAIEDIGVRLSPEKLEFYKWLDITEAGNGVFTAGIYSSGTIWELDGIRGTTAGFNIGGQLTAKDALVLSGSGDVDIAFKDGVITNWIMRNDVSEGDDFILRTGSQSLPALQVDQGTRTSTFGGHVQPSANALYSLGSSSQRWLTVYAMALNTPSDRRLKRDIEGLDYGLKELMKLRPVSYQWKAHPDRGRQLGLIAQDLQLVVPEVVTEADDEQKSLGVDYMALIPVLIASLQQQQEQIREQGEMISHQARQLEELRVQFVLQEKNPQSGDVVTVAVGSGQ